MKVKVKGRKKDFKPFKLEIEVESLEELKALLCSSNLSDYKIINSDPTNDDVAPNCESTYELYNALSKLYKEYK